ncbi:putative oxidoreductase CzcO [Poriferisphaera corsica]|uniref:Putative oxidoreductase CzcO n=1 Tax=Poriferisphaera corsica TaxID=2528020 RepID=A0A517YWR0_9BACT|nr:NAD(P)-binding domain-containing protein [Poriferisphaera corsica]QDU34664.1 putative oxidoreductase CzcO [Poriferisphaera corsica]
MTTPQHHNTILVGAGPIGLELAVNLKDKAVDYLHLDAGQVGQTISWYPRNVRFFSSPERIAIAGIPLHTENQEKASREQYLAYLRSIVEHFDLPINTHEPVIAATRDPNTHIFTIKTQKHAQTHTYTCENLILAIGDMHAPQKLNIPGEDLPNVSHYFDEPHTYFRQNLLIIGGRNSAVEAAIRCQRAGANVTLSYRRPKFDKSIIKYWLYPEIKSLIKSHDITFLPNTAPIRIALSHTTLAPASSPDSDTTISTTSPTLDTDHSKLIDIPHDFVLLLTGYLQDTSLFKQLGVQLHGINRQPKFNPDTMMTNIPNLYVAGTATAGTQTQFLVFIETSHIHTYNIIRSITHTEANPNLINNLASKFNQPES